MIIARSGRRAGFEIFAQGAAVDARVGECSKKLLRGVEEWLHCGNLFLKKWIFRSGFGSLDSGASCWPSSPSIKGRLDCLSRSS